MKIVCLPRFSLVCLASMLLMGTSYAPRVATGAPLVPGTGERLADVGDDFEDTEWKFNYNRPKGSADVDGKHRSPGGRAQNGRWYEGPDRGQPDVVRRIPTPEGGLPGSTGALLFASQFTGVPGVGNNQRAQDDLFLNIDGRLGRYIPVSQSPNIVVRVFVPPLENWENHTGSSFGLRATVRGSTLKEPDKTEPYWPGMFFNFQSETDRRKRVDDAHLAVRAGESGRDYRVLKVTQSGWWTLGMSFTPDGRVHYYAKPGIDDLTPDDHLASHYPYGFRCRSFISVFFDVFSQNDGQNWSTGWVIDDPTVYVRQADMLARKPARRGQQKHKPVR